MKKLSENYHNFIEFLGFKFYILCSYTIMSKSSASSDSFSYESGPVLGVRAPMVSPIQILHDLTDCVTTTNTKISKRLKRLRVACKCLNIDPDTYISNLVIPNEVGASVPLSDFKEYLERPEGSHEIGLFELTGAPNGVAKKAVEAVLTYELNSDLTLYYETCIIANKIVRKIQKHPLFGPFFDDKRIIFVHKGGIAQRISLLSKFPEYKEEIEEAFNLGGDNDCNIIVDPQLVDYERTRSLLVQFVHECMLKLVKRFTKGIAETKAKSISQITLSSGEESMVVPVKSIKRNNFNIYTKSTSVSSSSGDESEGVPSVLDVTGLKGGVYVTSNDTLKFRDEIGRICHFTLLRYKKGFKIGNRHVGAELLDISIPHRDESKACENFHHYYSGQWINFVYI